jgi:hypothetical protein
MERGEESNGDSPNTLKISTMQMILCCYRTILKTKLKDLVEESQKVGLRVNIEKTKNLRVNSRKTEAFKIGEEAIERVDDFLYLGSKIDENGGTLLDIQQRMNKARGAFSMLAAGVKHRFSIFVNRIFI